MSERLSTGERNRIIDTGRHVYGCCSDDCPDHGLPEDAQILAVESILATHSAAAWDAGALTSRPGVGSERNGVAEAEQPVSRRSRMSERLSEVEKDALFEAFRGRGGLMRDPIRSRATHSARTQWADTLVPLVVENGLKGGVFDAVEAILAARLADQAARLAAVEALHDIPSHPCAGGPGFGPGHPTLAILHPGPERDRRYLIGAHICVSICGGTRVSRIRCPARTRDRLRGIVTS